VKPVNREALLERLDRLSLTETARKREVSILIVDDEPDSIELLTRMLDRPGFAVLSTTSGAEGIERAQAADPDLVLLDLMMPDVSGFDVVDALRANPVTADTPIIIVTAKEPTNEDKTRLNGRVTALLQKGTFAAVDLVAWLDKTLQPPKRARKEDSVDESEPDASSPGRRGPADQHTARSDGTGTGRL
jgi:CheY-like chemotaxis protein